MLGIIIIVILIFVLIGALPHWGYAAPYGYGPSGFIGLILVIVLILLLLGHL